MPKVYRFPDFPVTKRVVGCPVHTRIGSLRSHSSPVQEKVLYLVVLVEKGWSWLELEDGGVLIEELTRRCADWGIVGGRCAD